MTNPDQVLEGAKPSLEEIGPFVYQFYQMRYNFEWDSNRDELSYSQHTSLIFDPVLTAKATNGKISSDDLKITNINLVFMGMQSQLPECFWPEVAYFLKWHDDKEKLFDTRSVNELINGYEVPLEVAGIDVDKLVVS